jgi:hypothetical protein
MKAAALGEMLAGRVATARRAACPIDRTGGDHTGSYAPIETLGAPGGLGGRRVLPAVIGAKSARGLHDLEVLAPRARTLASQPPFGNDFAWVSLAAPEYAEKVRSQFLSQPEHLAAQVKIVA